MEDTQVKIVYFSTYTSHLGWRLFSEPPPEGGLDLVTSRQGAI